MAVGAVCGGPDLALRGCVGVFFFFEGLVVLGLNGLQAEGDPFQDALLVVPGDRLVAGDKQMAVFRFRALAVGELSQPPEVPEAKAERFRGLQEILTVIVQVPEPFIYGLVGEVQATAESGPGGKLFFRTVSNFLVRAR